MTNRLRGTWLIQIYHVKTESILNPYQRSLSETLFLTTLDREHAPSLPIPLPTKLWLCETFTEVFNNYNIIDFTCAVIGSNITSTTREMCCSPGHWPELQLPHHRYCCPKAWKNKMIKKKHICGKCRKKHAARTVASWCYPKYCRDLFTLNPSASCFAPSAVILLLPRLFEKKKWC